VSIILAILVLGFLIFVHELGHFMVAKMAGIHVFEFSMGFGPLSDTSPGHKHPSDQTAAIVLQAG
jgi:membrane-associated protease RseP (regulator of RpoE activity)